MKKIGIYVNSGKDYQAFLDKLIAICTQNSLDFDIEYANKAISKQFIDYKKIDTVFVLGGDGTILGIARECFKYNVNIMSFNIGRLGFLTSCEFDEIEEKIAQLINDDYLVESRIMLKARIKKGDQILYESVAMNDVFVCKDGIAKTIEVSLAINDVPVNKIVADGMLVSTPTGSSAYSLSAGGPIISPNVDALLITPVCAHSFSARSMVVSHDSVITVHAESENDDLYMTIDGQIHQSFTNDQYIEICINDYKSHFIVFDKDYFYPRLKNKLIDWSL